MAEDIKTKVLFISEIWLQLTWLERSDKREGEGTVEEGGRLVLSKENNMCKSPEERAQHTQGIEVDQVRWKMGGSGEVKMAK